MMKEKKLRQFSDKYPILDLNNENDRLVVTLEASQFDYEKLDQFKEILKKDLYFFDGDFESVSEESIRINYFVEKEANSLSEIIPKLSLVDRLKLSQKLQFLSEFSDYLIVPYINPDNLFIIGDLVKVAHRGYSHILIPNYGNSDSYFNTYKALILYVINPKLSFVDLIDGSAAIRTPFSEEIKQSESFEELNRILDEQVAVQMAKQSEETTIVSKRRFNIYKWSTFILPIAVIVLVIFSSIMYFRVIPLKERIINAEIQFTNSNYAKTIDILKDDNPKKLPTGTKYVLAISSIKQDTLSNTQKKNVLKNISMKSNENILLYWTYLGFGKYEKTLDIAQNIGDTQMILYAYQKLYNKVSADSEMKGSEKQQKLKEYKEQIKNYEELLNGKDGDGESGNSE